MDEFQRNDSSLKLNDQSKIVHDITQLSGGEVVVATMGAIDPTLIAGGSGIVDYFANSNATLVNHDTDRVIATRGVYFDSTFMFIIINIFCVFVNKASLCHRQ